MAVDLRVQAWDINANTLLTDVLGATNLKFATRINDAGECSFEINTSDPIARQTYGVLDGLGGNEFKVLLTANGGSTILYSGIMWQSEKHSTDYKVTFRGKALTSYFQDVTIKNSYTTSIVPGQLIVQAIADAQATEPGANRGLQTRIIGYNTPPAITPRYNQYQYTLVGQVLADMTAGAAPGIGGTDYYVSDVFVNGAPQHTLNIVSPRAGRDSTASQLSIDLAQATDWRFPTDNFGSANHIIVVGGGTGGTQPVATADHYPRGGAGQQPLKEMVLQYSQVTVQSQLQHIANGAIIRYGQPVTTPVVTIPADYAPCQLGSYIIGDDVRLRMDPDPRFPNGYDQWWRIVAYAITVNPQGVPTVQLTFNPPPVF